MQIVKREKAIGGFEIIISSGSYFFLLKMRNNNALFSVLRIVAADADFRPQIFFSIET